MLRIVGVVCLCCVFVFFLCVLRVVKLLCFALMSAFVGCVIVFVV